MRKARLMLVSYTSVSRLTVTADIHEVKEHRVVDLVLDAIVGKCLPITAILAVSHTPAAFQQSELTGLGRQ